ncbi:hypothetical protein [Actinomadura parmotrematis]|uniref:Glycosyltransferase n=1 Tax=Actinomadura parmotrematis TaxID=2864039 RepID=A0ABS7FWU5_9ACTN|nr:hypothetical protein [Actinomadura parmotrematis]MBW8484455.1 hypothetical protein [Actinomadura parmotrematis]
MTVRRERPPEEAAPRGDGAGAAPAAPDARRPVLLAVVAAMATGTALFWLPLRGVDLDAMNGYGLIGVLPVATLLGAAVLVLTFMASLALPRPHRLLLSAQVGLLIISLHGVTLALEPIARFPTVWQTAGFIEYIERTRTVDWYLDARFNTPGFFSFMAFVLKAVGQGNIEPVLRWAPPVTNLLYLLPYILILRVLRATWRAKWFAAWLFVAANWVGQDYLSPQAFAYLLYLFFVAILVNWFRHHDETTRRAGRRRTRETRERAGAFWRVYGWLFGPKDPGELPAPKVSVREQSILLFLLFALLLVGTAAHQLTPFLMTAACGGLVLLRRCSLRGMPIIAGVVYAAWVSFMTVGYWASRKEEVFGGLGKVFSNVEQSTGGRIGDVDGATQQLQYLRILIAVTVLGLAVAGLLRRRARGIDDRVALVLMLVPFSSVGLQNYGGEIGLRIYFFMLPAACLLIAYLFFPAPFDAPRVRDPKVAPRFGRWRTGRRRHLPAVAVASLFALSIAGGFLAVRYGNEKYEQVRPSDVRAFDVMLADYKQTIGVVWLSADDPNAVGGMPSMPWSYRSWERFNYAAVVADREDPANVSQIIETLKQQGPGGFFVTTRSHEDFQVLNSGLRADYAARMRAALAASPQITTVFADRDAAVYRLRTPPAQPVVAVPKPAGLGLRSSPWTPAGLIYLPILLAVLLARELRRLRLLAPAGPGGEPPEQRMRRLRPLTVLALPLLLSVAAVIIERFLVIT